MDWIGDPMGSGFFALLGLALLVLVTVAYARLARDRRHAEFHAAEPRREELPEYHFELEDIRDPDDVPPRA